MITRRKFIVGLGLLGLFPLAIPEKPEIVRLTIGSGWSRTDYSDGRMVIEARGRVGIGEMHPPKLLEVRQF